MICFINGVLGLLRPDCPLIFSTISMVIRSPFSRGMSDQFSSIFLDYFPYGFPLET